MRLMPGAELIEIDKYIISEFVKRVSGSSDKKLNELTMRLPQNNKITVNPNYSVDLKKKLENIIVNYQEYSKKKSIWKQETRYDSFEFEIQITLDDKELISKLINLDLGFTDKVDISKLSKKHTWFGQEIEDFHPSFRVSIEINTTPQIFRLGF